MDFQARPEMGVYAPRWSPDGAWIAYAMGFLGPLRLVRPDAGDLRIASVGTVSRPGSRGPPTTGGSSARGARGT